MGSSRSMIMALVAIAAMTIVQPGFAGEGPEAVKTGNPTVVMETSEGVITIELWADKSPITVKNFLRYAMKYLDT